MSNGELIDLLAISLNKAYDALERRLDMRKPGADENPPRNYYCGRCRQWLPASAFPTRTCMCAHAAHLEMPCICGAGGHQCGGTP